jgi:glycosyltransferase involved in cell wall biosynthesis
MGKDYSGEIATRDYVAIADELESSARRDIMDPSGREMVPIVVVVYHREEVTRQMFAQLAEVTRNYSLIIVNNGFDDPDFLHSLKPEHYIENVENNGAIASINQGLDLARGDYVAVLHNDLLIFDEGWLDHVIKFMDRRQDVGLVGLGGRHGIAENGALIILSTVIAQRGYAELYKPTWRMTEVATIDGLGWVMRNRGFRLDESFGYMHFYDLDLSLQYIDAGDRVYVAAVDLYHLAVDDDRSSRSNGCYLEKIGGDDVAYYDEVREKFRAKWAHLLPIWRGGRDEGCLEYTIADYLRMEAEFRKLSAEMKKVAAYVRRLEVEWQQKCDVIVDLDAHCAALTEDLERLRARLR